MTTIPEVARPPVGVLPPNSHSTVHIAAPLLTDHPEEFDPVELLWMMQRCGWTTTQFAIAFGCSLHCVYKWSITRKPSRLARIRAADLKRQWKI